MTSNIDNLVTMANQIGGLFETMKYCELPSRDIASYLRRFWEPRMRIALRMHWDDIVAPGDG